MNISRRLPAVVIDFRDNVYRLDPDYHAIMPLCRVDGSPDRAKRQPIMSIRQGPVRIIRGSPDIAFTGSNRVAGCRRRR